jgi:dihydroneopterin aldolase
MADDFNLSPLPRPAIVDHIALRDINLPLPVGPDPWHRSGRAQPCTASVKLSYSSAVAAATADDVSLSIDYGKLYRRIESEIHDAGKSLAPGIDTLDIDGSQSARRKEILLGRDVRILAGIIANCGLGLLDETIAGVRRMAHTHQSSPTRRRASQASRRMSSGSSITYTFQTMGHTGSPAGGGSEPLDSVFGQCEVWVHLPKALLRAEEGLKFRSVTAWGYDQSQGSPEDAVETGRKTLVLEQEFRIQGIRCYCILGVNSHERVEKQCVIVTLAFRGSGGTVWGSTAVETYQEMAKVVAEVGHDIWQLFVPRSLLTECRTESGRHVVPDRRGSGDIHRAHRHDGIRQRQCDRDGGETERIAFRGEVGGGDYEI